MGVELHALLVLTGSKPHFFSGKLIVFYCKFLLVVFGVVFFGGIGPFIPLAVSLLE